MPARNKCKGTAAFSLTAAYESLLNMVKIPSCIVKDNYITGKCIT